MNVDASSEGDAYSDGNPRLPDGPFGGRESGGVDGGTLPDCPPTTMVIVTEGAVSYQIDQTEVTQCQYATWLATNPTAQVSECSWNTGFAPHAGLLCMDPALAYQPSAHPNDPVVCVDWCGAAAYCRSLGKRLCGKIGGGTNNQSDFAKASLSQWFAACSSGGILQYPYGNMYDGTSCVGRDYDGTPDYQPNTDVAVPVGSAARCHGSAPLDQLFDMSGNVDEWEDSCYVNSGPDDVCNIRGGSFEGDLGLLLCAGPVVQGRARSSTDQSVGFRCCGD